jgi:FKBP-type peptidyl-prolyl cis-trans isomerase FkpA
MKQILYTLLFFIVFGTISCRKDKIQQTIKQYDDAQILNYIAVHHLTGYVKDLVGGDTSGIYYKIITQDTTQPKLAYTTQIPMVYTVKTFDGTYASTDMIANHFYNYVGHVQSSGLPLGLQTALHNDLIYGGSSMEVLIPSHLAYGINGTGSGSSQVANNRIAGNECLDYYVNIIKMVPTPHYDSKGVPIYVGVTTQYITDPAYDDLSIQQYMTDSTSLVGYNKTADGLYYKVLTQGTGTDSLTDNSTATVTYTGQLFNATIFDQYNTTGGTPLQVGALTPGVREGFKTAALLNAKISMLIPSSLAYGVSPPAGIPPFSCLRFTFVVDAVSP